MRRFTLLLLAAVAGQAWGQVTVVSSRPDAVTLTVYRQGIAQVTETRSVDLPAGPVELVFQGVVDTLLPQSAVLSGAGRPVTETNFDFDQLSPASLVERSVGMTVTIVRTNRRSGVVTRQQATIVSASASAGVVFRTAEGNEALKCSGLPERLEFNGIPAGLRSAPTLSARLAGGVPGRHRVQISYLVHGITWSADYVARLNAAADRMALSGWVTLTNNTSVNFDRAEVQLVSGDLGLVAVSDGGSVDWNAYGGPSVQRDVGGGVMTLAEPAKILPLGKCAPVWPQALPAPPAPPPGQGSASADSLFGEDEDELLEVRVTGSRISRESLGDYKLYRLPEPTDLKARQTKQALFLSKPRVKVERLYVLASRDFDPDEEEDEEALRTPKLGLLWRNVHSAGLGEPLPGGKLRVFERLKGSEVYAGGAVIPDKPVGLPVEVFYADAMGISVERSREPEPEYPDKDQRKIAVAVQHTVTNDKGVPVTVLVRHNPERYLGFPRVLQSNRPVADRDGVLGWRIRIPAGSRRVLGYALEADNIPQD